MVVVELGLVVVVDVVVEVVVEVEVELVVLVVVLRISSTIHNIELSTFVVLGDTLNSFLFIPFLVSLLYKNMGSPDS